MSRSSELGTLASCSTVILDLDADATASGPGINGVMPVHLDEISVSPAKSSKGEEHGCRQVGEEHHAAWV